MIYTVTLNPAVDYIVQVKGFEPGKINRVDADYKYPGGKGINVSRVLNILNIKSTALGFLGGFTGDFISNYLKAEGIDTDFIRVMEDTRINIKLKSEEETEINGAGPNIDEEALEVLFKKIENLTSEDFLVLSGNIQKSLPADMYAKLQSRCTDKRVKVVVDTTGEALLSTLKYKPFLIKPNNHELGELFNVNIDSRDKILYYAKELVKLGAQNVIVSMAAEGALLISQQGVYHASAPKGTVQNSVGAGDSLIGGFLASYSRSSDLIDSFKWGATAGSATAFSMDLCTKQEVEALLSQVIIEKIE